MEDLKVGDIVVLKSGGPKMTVTYTADDVIAADCAWFVNQQSTEVSKASFPIAALTKVS